MQLTKIDGSRLFSMEGKRVIVTGGASGIGRTVANYMSSVGADIIIFDVNLEGAKETAAELKELYGTNTAAFACDVTDPEDIEKVLDEVFEAYGAPANVLVNNAGIGQHKFCLDVTKDEWLRVNDVNYNGMFYMAAAFSRRLVREKMPGCIINTCSMSAKIVNVPQQQIAYNSSKGGVLHMTRTLAVELAPHGIRVNSVSPGYMFTPMTAKRPQELKDFWMARIPQGRMGTPEDLATAYIYLASDFSKYTTGCDIVVDGGYTNL